MKIIKYIFALTLYIIIISIIYVGAVMKRKTEVEIIKEKIKNNPYIKIYTKEDNGLLTNWISDITIYDKYVFLIYDRLESSGYGVLNKETDTLESTPMKIKLRDNKEGLLFYSPQPIYKIFPNDNFIYFIVAQSGMRNKILYKYSLITGKTEEIYDTKKEGNNFSPYISLYKYYLIFHSYPKNLSLYNKEHGTWSYISGIEDDNGDDQKIINNKLWSVHSDKVSVIDFENKLNRIIPLFKMFNLSLDKKRIWKIYYKDNFVWFYIRNKFIPSKEEECIILKYDINLNKWSKVNIFKNKDKVEKNIVTILFNGKYFFLNYQFEKKKYLTKISTIIYDYEKGVFVQPEEFTETFLFNLDSIGIDDKYTWFGTSDCGLLRIEKTWVDKVMEEKGFKPNGIVEEPITPLDVKEEVVPIEWK